MTTEAASRLAAALADRYRIERELGAGGMATVYLAHDIRHDRSVAIKVLKPELGAVLGVERFLAEIKVTANLQHPNVLPLFDSGAAGELLFYVMPFVEGESLRTRLDREKQLPIEDAVEIACAIARAIDYAHGHGVVHRDLKPENVLLQAGQPLLADFGIALAMSRAGGQRMTESGLSLGTPEYMSPEQAAADRTIDGRTDIYALGALTYEMLTGDPPHTGSTAQAVVARIMTELPRPVRASRASVSEQVERAIDKALAKVPADRWSTGKAFAVALTEAGPATMAVARPRPAAAARMTRVREGIAWVLAIAGIGVAGYLATRSATPQAAVRFVVDLPEHVAVFTVLARSLALSNDGSELAILTAEPGRNSIYLRRLDDTVAHLLRGTDGADEVGGFSPDGRWLIYAAGGELKKMLVDGGTPQTLAKAGHEGRWSDRAEVVYASDGGIWAIPSDGGTPRQVTTPATAAPRVTYDDPDPLPGGDYALVTIRTGSRDSSRIGVVSLRDGHVTDLGILGMSPAYAAPGRVVLARNGGRVVVAPFSLRSRAVTGPALPLLDQVDQAGPGTLAFAVSHNGTLAYGSGSGVATGVEMYRVSPDGTEHRLNSEVQRFKEPRLSPDGLRVVTTILPGGQAATTTGLWLFDIRAQTLTLLQRDSVLMHADWSPDGSHVVYVHQQGDSQMVMSRPWDGSGAPTVLARGRRDAILRMSLGRAHGLSAFGGPDNTVLIAPTDSLAAMRPLGGTATHGSDPRISPDGSLVAYVSDETGQDAVYVQETAPPGRRVTVSTTATEEPVWSRDGTRLFFQAPTRVLSATIVERPTLAVTRRDSLFVNGYYFPGYDLFRNGDFLMIRRPVIGSKVFVIVNWPQLGAPKGPSGR